MDGIFNVLKPPDMTSFDVVAYLRRALKTKKIGHGGTLDPDASGVLPVFAGTATRLLEFAVEGEKEYIAEFTLGVQTDTGDDAGTIIKTMPVPSMDEALLKDVLQKFLGKQMQVPPMYSALKVDGQKLYHLARKGIEVEREAREIEIFALDLLNFTDKTFTLRIKCSKGTYIRVLGEDICSALGTCGTMSFLLRTQVAGFFINEAYTLAEIVENPEACMSKPVAAASELAKVILTPKQAFRVTNGVRTTIRNLNDGRYAIIGPNKEFLGIGLASEGMLKAEKILEHYPKPEED
ncbi:MAG: tRNA pseudouridine(55) synthase TruB [Phascolarctobacterium sp.]|nr:tRNA pseudouridine(55) synthase TruB [Phascolarctobacterium sp.]